MKKLFTLVALMLSFTFYASAQGSSLKVVNFSNCEVHFELMGSTAGSCGVSSIGPFTTLACCSTSVFYPDPTAVPMPGLSPTDWFLGALLYDRDPSSSCGTTYNVYKIGEPCTGYAPGQTYVSINTDCRKECVVKATWTTGALIFN